MSKKKHKDKKEEPKETKISIQPPWEGDAPQRIEASQGSVIDNVSQTIRYTNGIVGEAFLKERSRVHETYIKEEQQTKRLILKEEQRTKRISLVIGGILFLAAAAVITFAPESREILSYWVGGALVILAAGAAGYKRVWGKYKEREISLDKE
jgi:hypothetical protein